MTTLECENRKTLKGKALVAYKKTLKLNSVQRQVLIGTLLGDAFMPQRAGKPEYKIKFEQKQACADFIYHLYELFKPFVGTGPQLRHVNKSKPNEPKLFSAWFTTYTHESFKFYYHLFYKKDGSLRFKKRVPKDIHRFLTRKALAYWFMDDGTYTVTTSGNHVYYLSTQGYNYDDQIILKNALKTRFNLNVTIHKSTIYYRLYIPLDEAEKFVKLISPYIRETFRYKIKNKQD